MGFWCPELGAGFYADVPFRIRGDKIFFWEATCVLAALNWCAREYAPGLYLDRRARVSILTDNENTVHLFDSLAALPMYNDTVYSRSLSISCYLALWIFASFISLVSIMKLRMPFQEKTSIELAVWSITCPSILLNPLK
jgi:hypothetical protein